mmetsp:Transcript_25382/g.80382  ORF Transcript_25382/g.80382 Transcript_25382/m.80382 type:complete len:235 (+) Transcript_25382:1130-1834(+)
MLSMSFVFLAAFKIPLRMSNRSNASREEPPSSAGAAGAAGAAALLRFRFFTRCPSGAPYPALCSPHAAASSIWELMESPTNHQVLFGYRCARSTTVFIPGTRSATGSKVGQSLSCFHSLHILTPALLPRILENIQGGERSQRSACGNLVSYRSPALHCTPSRGSGGKGGPGSRPKIHGSKPPSRDLLSRCPPLPSSSLPPPPGGPLLLLWRRSECALKTETERRSRSAATARRL